MYCGTQTRIATGKQFCDQCGTKIQPGELYTELVYDLATDAEDGYGDFDYTPLCQDCADP